MTEGRRGGSDDNQETKLTSQFTGQTVDDSRDNLTAVVLRIHARIQAGGGVGRSPVVDELVVYGVARSSLHDVALSLLVSERDGRDLGRRGDRPERRREPTRHDPRAARSSQMYSTSHLFTLLPLVAPIGMT